MKELTTDVCVIGGGPAGMAAALEAYRGGAQVVVIERDWRLGGILQQCIHDGFGLMRFGKSLTGPSYAQHFIDEIEETSIDVLLDTMVLEITPSHEVWAVNSHDGMIHVQCGALILAMGCRERTAAQAGLHGYRPQGVITAGACQRYINVDGYLPGTRAVIVGSGDVGLIMARRMTLEGISVEGVYEIAPHPGGLARNIVQCLEDYNIPLHLSHAVVSVHGKDRITGVTVARIDSERSPIPGTEREIDCDLLVLAAGLIPENELSREINIEMDPHTRGPLLDENLMTSIPGIFSAGNVAVVFDLVDYVSLAGERAARGALAYIKDNQGKESDATRISMRYIPVEKNGNISLCVPQRISSLTDTTDTCFYVRVNKPQDNVVVSCYDVNTGVEYAKQRLTAVAPATMLAVKATLPADAQPCLSVHEVR